MTVHLRTADTFEKQTFIDQILNQEAIRVTPGSETRQKADSAHKLGANSVVAHGQCAYDGEMLKATAFGISVISPEGTVDEAIMAAGL